MVETMRYSQLARFNYLIDANRIAVQRFHTGPHWTD